MSYSKYPEFDDYQRRWDPDDSTTFLTSAFLGAIIGACALFKTADVLGYPVWLWLHQLAHMASTTLSYTRAAVLRPSSDSDENNDTMQRSGRLGSLLQKGVRGVASAFSTGASDVPPGLGNISNSCYQNSVIQGLASLPSLHDYLESATSEHNSLTHDTTNGALFEIIRKLNNPDNRGQHFWIRGKLKSMSTFEQQDAQEYYSNILDSMEKEVKKASGSKRRTSVSLVGATKDMGNAPEAADDDRREAKEKADKTQTPADQAQSTPNPLDGLQAQRVGCTSCGHSDGLTLTPFNCVTVSLGTSYSYDVRECLDRYTSLEYIDGVECPKCTLLKLKKTLAPLVANKPGSLLEAKLDAVQDALDEEDFEDKTLLKTFNIPKKNWVQSTKSKQIVIARAPQSLVLHVNRSSFNENTGMSYKNTAGVLYPSILDLGNWCLGSAPSGSQEPDMSMEEWPRDPRASMLPDGEPMSTSPFQYKLRAAVTHYGSHGNGHYVCYRSHPEVIRPEQDNENGQSEKTEEEGKKHVQAHTASEQWWRFSDDSVYAVSEEQAHQGNVFMLFYERIEESTSLPLPEADAAAESNLVSEEAPLPPADTALRTQTPADDEAAAITLPDDDDLLDLIPPGPTPTSPTPPQLSAEDHNAPLDMATNTEAETSDTESVDAPSTQLTSDYDSEAEVAMPPTESKSVPIPPVSPHLMRTAGNKTSRGQSGRQSLPLVSAT